MEEEQTPDTQAINAEQHFFRIDFENWKHY